MTDPVVQSAAEKDKGKFTRFFQDGDMDSIAELYTENCSVMAPGTDVKQGRKAVAQLMRTVKANGVSRVEVKSELKSLEGEYGYRIGRWTMFGEDGTVCDTGKSLAVMKKVDGAYKIHNEMLNSVETQTPTWFRES
ncbi:uncharacterized protein [Ptychodera flava]|uniref:uncharacterized protein n=1 Tax=Ptychodera flava TaxID=63121 RepID=UPI00396A7ECE